MVTSYLPQARHVISCSDISRMGCVATVAGNTHKFIKFNLNTEGAVEAKWMSVVVHCAPAEVRGQ